MFECEKCWYNDYDESEVATTCRQYLTEDDISRILLSPTEKCPFFRDGKDYNPSKQFWFEVRAD